MLSHLPLRVGLLAIAVLWLAVAAPASAQSDPIVFDGTIGEGLMDGDVPTSGASGFIVFVDAWNRITRKVPNLSFTSRIILRTTALFTSLK